MFLINKLRNTTSTNILMPFLSFSDNLPQGYQIIFQIKFGNFVHKTYFNFLLMFQMFWNSLLFSKHSTNTHTQTHTPHTHLKHTPTPVYTLGDMKYHPACDINYIESIESISLQQLQLSTFVYDRIKSRGLAERGQEEEQKNEQHQGYIFCLGYLATID